MSEFKMLSLFNRAARFAGRSLIGSAFVGGSLIGASTGVHAASANAAGMSRMTAYTISFDGLNGGKINLMDYAGKPVLVVNTASFCGFTNQYDGLAKVYKRYKDRGLVVIGVPSNDFGGQEPGGPKEITATAKEHGVTFPMAAKAKVKGPQAHRFYTWAAQQKPGATPRWNFHKYLIGRDGHIAAVFDTRTKPDDPKVIVAIETELAKGK